MVGSAGAAQAAGRVATQLSSEHGVEMNAERHAGPELSTDAGLGSRDREILATALADRVNRLGAEPQRREDQYGPTVCNARE